MSQDHYPRAPDGSALQTLFDSLAEIGAEYAGASGKGGSFYCPNPGHDDEHASFDVSVGKSAAVVFTCTPCRQMMGSNDALAALLREEGLRWDGDYVDPEEVEWGSAAPGGRNSAGGRGRLGKPIDVYTYCFGDGSPNFKVYRFEPGDGAKVFLPKRFEHGEYVGGSGALDGVERTPYRLERFADWAEKFATIYLVEGEKTAKRIHRERRPATTFHGGSNATPPEGWTDWFTAFTEVRIWPDADEAGVQWARARAEELRAAGVSVSYWGDTAAHVEPKDDAYDVLERGRSGRVLADEDLDDLAALHPLPRPGDRPSAPEDEVRIGGKVIKSVSGGSKGGPGSKTEREKPYPVTATGVPVAFAREYLNRHYTDEEGRLLLRFADDRFWLWSEAPGGGSMYRDLTDLEVAARLARHLEGAREIAADGARRITVQRKTYSELIPALQRATLVSEHGEAGVLAPATGGVPFRNGWLDVATGELVGLSPERDIRWLVQGDYDPDAGEPVEWLAFLDSIGFKPETDEHRLLKQWFGYLLSGSTEQQKALLMIGPPRAGKGTILKVAEAMLGRNEGAVGLDLSAFSDRFGLSPVIGKGLAIVDDARFEMRTDKATVRTILSMVAEGTISVDRKYRDPLSVRIGARLMMATNELPAMVEASEALASRFLFLKFERSFLRREDITLLNRLTAELPSIVRWALEGLDDLRAEVDAGRGFTETRTGRKLQREMSHIGNPIRTFVEDECEIGDGGHWITTDELYGAYRVWAEPRGHYVMNEALFARDLRAAYPALKQGQKRIGNKRPRGYYGIRLSV